LCDATKAGIVGLGRVEDHGHGRLPSLVSWHCSIIVA
jgi:hypothetical protein